VKPPDSRRSDHSVLASVLDIVVGIAGPNRTPPDPGTSTRLWEGGFWLDSIDLLDLMFACDETFGRVFERMPRTVMADIRTVGDLVAVIEARPHG
jgi:acyl carrier protein